MKTMKYTLLILMSLTLAGCGSDDPAAPGGPDPEPVPMADVTWRAERLNVIEDCDASSGAGPGDFYISFTLSDYTSGTEVVLADQRRTLVQVSRGNVVWHDDMNISLTSEVPLRDGTRLLLSMSIYENDPDGPQVSVGNGWYYTYDAASGSWVSEDDGDKTMRFGRFVQETLPLEDNLGDACEAYLRGRFSMEPAGE